MLTINRGVAERLVPLSGQFDSQNRSRKHLQIQTALLSSQTPDAGYLMHMFEWVRRCSRHRNSTSHGIITHKWTGSSQSRCHTSIRYTTYYLRVMGGWGGWGDGGGGAANPGGATPDRVDRQRKITTQAHIHTYQENIGSGRTCQLTERTCLLWCAVWNCESNLQ